MRTPHWALAVLVTTVAAGPAMAQGADDDLSLLLGDTTAEPEAGAPPADDGGSLPESDSASAGAASDEPAQANPDPAPEAVATIPVEPSRAPNEPPAPRAPRSRLVEEIVVTAQKREENLQDVPISVQAFSGDKLDAMGITDQKDLPLITPGLNIGTQISYTTVFLRGVGTDAYLTADPSVATYVDGIYFPFAQGLVQDFGAVERIEVLKGPQGTLFGRNATGGAISVVTEAPQLDRFYGAVDVNLASWPQLQTRQHVNVPVADWLAFSVSTIYNESDWYVDGIAAGEPLDEDVTKGVRGKVRIAPADWLDATLAVLKLKVNGAGSNFTPHHQYTPLGELLLAGTTPAEPYKGEVDSPIYNKLDNSVYYGQVQLFPGPLDVKLLGSYQDIDTEGWYDFDGSTRPLVSFAPPKNFSRSATAELQLVSNEDSWGSAWLKWIVGGYYFKGKSGLSPVIAHFGNLNPDLIAPGLLPDLLPLPAGGPIRLDIYGTLLTDSYSFFAQSTASLTDWLDLTLGLRYQSEAREIGMAENRIVNEQTGSETPFLGPYDTATDSDGNEVPGSDTTKKLSPKVSLEMRPEWMDGLVYLSYQQATKSSTYNTTVVTGGPTYVRPETITAYELGLKTTLFDGLMSVEAATWYYDIEDLQVQFFALANGGIVSFENAPAARSYGAELGTTTQLFPSLVDDLVLLFGAAYTKATYTDFPNASGFPEPGYVFSQNVDVTGNDIVRSPELSGNASLSKSWYFGSSSIEFTGDYYYNAGFYLEATNVSRTHQKAYDVIGARLSYFYEPWKLRLTAFGKNLTDTLYSQGGQPNDFGDAINYAPPLTYGLRINWEFGDE